MGGIIINILMSTVLSTGFDESLSQYDTWICLVILLTGGGTWIWALVDNMKKPENFYIDYPNGLHL